MAKESPDLELGTLYFQRCFPMINSDIISVFGLSFITSLPTLTLRVYDFLTNTGLLHSRTATESPHEQSPTQATSSSSEHIKNPDTYIPNMYFGFIQVGPSEKQSIKAVCSPFLCFHLFFFTFSFLLLF